MIWKVPIIVTLKVVNWNIKNPLSGSRCPELSLRLLARGLVRGTFLMASRRMIRDWTDSETIDQLSQGAEVFFTRLIMKADDYGNYTGNLMLLRAALFPLKGYDPELIEKWIGECSELELIQTYEVDKKPLIHIKNFDQKLRRYHAVYPPPPVGNPPSSSGQVADKRPPEL